LLLQAQSTPTNEHEEFAVSSNLCPIAHVITIAFAVVAATSIAPLAQAQSKPAKPKVAACGLLTNDEVAKAVGKPILSSGETPISSDMGACSYYADAAKAIPLLAVQLHTSKGALHYSLYCETNKGDVKPGEPIAGLGDQACLRDRSALFVRKGDKVAMISGAVAGNPRDPLIGLAKAALARM
jgi:hypothetical protein